MLLDNKCGCATPTHFQKCCNFMQNLQDISHILFVTNPDESVLFLSIIKTLLENPGSCYLMKIGWQMCKHWCPQLQHHAQHLICSYSSIGSKSLFLVFFWTIWHKQKMISACFVTRQKRTRSESKWKRNNGRRPSLIWWSNQRMLEWQVKPWCKLTFTNKFNSSNNSQSVSTLSPAMTNLSMHLNQKCCVIIPSFTQNQHWCHQNDNTMIVWLDWTGIYNSNSNELVCWWWNEGLKIKTPPTTSNQFF